MDYGQHSDRQYLHGVGGVDSPLHDMADPQFDSSSSSGSDNHSSPAESSYTATSQHDWALDGLSLDLALPWSPGAPPTLAALDPGFITPSSKPPQPHESVQQVHATDSSSKETLTLTHDFWNAAPDAHAIAAADHHLHTEAATRPTHGSLGEVNGSASRNGIIQAQQTGATESMQMDFDDVVHGDVCGPATLSSSPQPEAATTATLTSTSLAGHASLAFASTHAQTAPNGSHASFSMPIDLLAVNAGIAPALTSVDGGAPRSGHATPERFVSPAPESRTMSPYMSSTRATSISHAESQTQEPSNSNSNPNTNTNEQYSLRRSSAATTTRSSRASTREHSVSRASDTSASSSSAAAPNQRAASGSSKAAAAAASKAAPFSSLGIVNLVARDAVLASKLIPTAAAPSGDELVAAVNGANGRAGAAVPELLVLGVPTVGAKSRVETQIKITLALVRPQRGIKREDDGVGVVGNGKAAWILPDGGLDERAAQELERVETWTHLRLPKHLALKSKEKKSGTAAVVKPKPSHPVPDPAPESTLNLDVAVVSASDPTQRIYICSNCEQRELKRSLRRKDSKGKTFTAPIPIPDPNDPPRNEDEERQKVVVFNAQEVVDFQTGEVVLPTRVTCYCRHHKEKKGFCITYAVRDHRGHLVAEGTSPAIMITDDHKTNTSKAAAAAAAAAASAQVSAAEDSGPKRKGSKSAAASVVKGKKDKAASPPATTSRSRRGTSGRSRRGQTESDDEQDPARKSRPYDSDARPSRKRSSNTHRSPMFAMTPLAPMTQQQQQQQQHQSKPPSPALTSTSFASAEPQSDAVVNAFSSALGLNGLGDTEMGTSAESAYDSRQSSVGCISTNGIDWRAGISTPPLSPGSTEPSVADTFQSIFSGFPSPVSAVQETSAVRQASSGSIPSFAIPATEPIPPSFAPSWAMQQQPQQLEPPAPPPRINRVIPGEGPVHGGIEVTVLGDNFVRDLTCVFGDNAAVPTHYWSANTLVCVLPPSANPGPVVVGIKGVPLTPDPGSGLQLFTYKDTSDRSLLELALQVVGMQMTGRIEDAAAIAMRIVANGSGNGQNGMGGGGRAPNGGGGASGGATDTAALAATLETATRSAYATPTGSQASSRRSSFTRPSRAGPPTNDLSRIANGETRNFEGIVIKFLSLLDLDPSLIPGAAPSLPASQPPISLVNEQRHTLLHLATVLGFHRLVAFLLARGIALDSADRNGYTALHFAALYGRVAITRLLLDAGAKTDARTLAGRTPLDIAIERDDIDVEELLVARGAEPSRALPSTPTPIAGPSSYITMYSPVSQGRQPSAADPLGRRGSAASTHSRSSFFFEAGEDDTDADTEYPSDWTVEGDSWDENDDADVDESESEDATPHPRSRLASRNASTVSLQYLLAAEAEVESRSERYSPRVRKQALPGVDDIPLAQPVTGSDVTGDASNSSWISQKLRPTAEGVSTAWEKAKATRFGVPSMQMPDVGHALQLRGTRRRRATESAVVDETDGNESTATSSSRFSASPFRDWTPAFRTPQWWHTAKAPSSPPPKYTPSDSLALGPAPEKVALEAPVAPSLEKTRTTSFKAMRARVQRRLSSTSHSTGDSDTETDAGSTSFDAHRPANLAADVMLFAFWIPVLVVVLWFAYRNWEEYASPVISGLSDTLLPTRIARIFA